MDIKVLNKVNSPRDLKALTIEELAVLADEIRNVIINKVSQVGGHFGPNLGMVEATIAMHYMYLIHLWTKLYTMFPINVIHTKF